jgi:intein/homing endonuclease
MKRYKCNEYYFDSIDKEIKAYFLGLIFADGCISDTRWTKKLNISLQIKDKYILEIFKKEINFEGSIRINKKTQALIEITSNILCEKLIKLGCIPRKSLILKFPNQIPIKYIRHFIRGYFDGDGCITYSFRKPTHKTPHFRADIAGTLRFCKKCNDIIKNKVNLNGNIRPQGKIYRLHFGGNNQIRKLGKFLYQNSTIYLTRKKIKFDYLNDCKVITTSKYKHINYRTYELKRKNLNKKWLSTIKVNGKTKYVGAFKTEFDAYLGLCAFEELNNLPFSNNPNKYLKQKIN